jgi:hypothetical protein
LKNGGYNRMDLWKWWRNARISSLVMTTPLKLGRRKLGNLEKP